MYLSKSKYTQVWSCPKAAWLSKNKPEQASVDENAKTRMKTGVEVGELARGLFGDYVNVTVASADGHLDLTQMIENTQREMGSGTPAICEASFSYEGLYCAVDILRKDGNGWSIYEVKSSTDPNQDIYIADVSYQKYVLGKCGVHVTRVCIVCLDNQYIYDGTLKLEELFLVTDVTKEAEEAEKNVPATLRTAETVLNSMQEPKMELAEACVGCAYWTYCTSHLPQPNVFDLYRLSTGKKLDYYRKGIVSFEALKKCGMIKNDKQRRQIEFALGDCGTWTDREKIREFLDTLTYPLYFLDFESMQPAIPFCVGTRPYAQIPFQYSLHFIESEGSPLQHREFLAESGSDPRRAIAEALCRDIPKEACVTAYNKSFECSRLKELAAAFPDLGNHLLAIADRVIDLLVPFQSGYYYNRAMGGSFSIKSVLPAIYPDDPSLDYHNLKGVHNGGEAMSIFPQIQYMEPAEKEQARNNLLKYCELDTYAMVKVWEALRKAAE